MVVERDVLIQNVRKVLLGRRIYVLNTVVERDVLIQNVRKVQKERPIYV